MVPPTANIEALREELAATGIPFFVGGKFITQHDAPPRYVVQWGSAMFGPAKMVGGNPRARYTDDWTVRVHCWGRTFEEAYRMRQALLMACLLRLCESFTVAGTDIISDEEHVVDGHLMTVPITISCPLYDAVIGPTITDDVKRRGRADAIEFAPFAVAAIGGAPPLAITGAAHPSVHVVEAEIISAGMRGAAAFRYRVNAGPWSDVTPTAAAIALDRTGLTAAFPAGPFARGNRWVFSDTATAAGDGRMDATED